MARITITSTVNPPPVHRRAVVPQGAAGRQGGGQAGADDQEVHRESLRLQRLHEEDQTHRALQEGDPRLQMQATRTASGTQ